MVTKRCFKIQMGKKEFLGNKEEEKQKIMSF